MDKGGQVTIFIILAIIVVAMVILFFMFKDNLGVDIGGGKEFNSNAFLDSCLENKIKDAVEILAIQGGDIEPKFYKEFKFTEEEDAGKISYLCYTRNYEDTCINQEPMLISHIENEIKSYISSEVDACFDDLTVSLDREWENVEVEYKTGGFEVNLHPNRILVDINGKIILTKTGQTSTQEDFQAEVGSNLFELVEVSQKIIDKEVNECDFDHFDFMNLYPEFDVDKTLTRDSSIIYTIKQKNIPTIFRFAIRGCVFAPGY